MLSRRCSDRRFPLGDRRLSDFRNAWLHRPFLLSPHWRNEAVTAPGHSFNKLLPIPVFAQRLPQDRDVVRQIDFFNDGVGPDGFQQFVFFQQMSVVFDQDEEQMKALG